MAKLKNAKKMILRAHEAFTARAKGWNKFQQDSIVIWINLIKTSNNLSLILNESENFQGPPMQVSMFVDFTI